MMEKQIMLKQLVIEPSTVFVKLCFANFYSCSNSSFNKVTQKALFSPWGRMMRAIR